MSVKLAGKKRWNISKDDQRDIIHLELLADSNHNTIRYYMAKAIPIPALKLEKIERQSSKILGLTRSILGRNKWFNQLTLKRFYNPAPNHDPRYKNNNNNNNSKRPIYI